MKKLFGIYFMIMCFFAILLTINIEEISYENTMINIILLLILAILELILTITKDKDMIITIVELFIIVFSLFNGIESVIYLMPIVVFQLFKRKNILFSLLVATIFLLFLNSIDRFNMMIYIIITNLYLYEVKKNYTVEKELRKSNRDNREEKYRIKEKLNNLEKYLEQNTIIASLKERNFMAQKMHDHLGHRITSSLMQLEVTKELLDSNPELSKRYLITATENLREGMDEIRELLKGIKPREKVLGIEDIKEELLKFQYNSRIKTKLNIEGELEKIRLTIWLDIEENLKESLTNIAKHSKATEVTVSILVYNKILRVEIRDNGEGSENMDRGERDEGLGLRGIKERVEALSGRVQCFNDNGFVINMIYKI